MMRPRRRSTAKPHAPARPSAWPPPARCAVHCLVREALAMTEPRAKYPPYLIRRPGADAVRYFWQPSRMLRSQGWRPQRVPDNWRHLSDPDELKRAAIARAEEINRDLAKARAVRAGGPPRTGDELTARYDDLLARYRALRPHRLAGWRRAAADAASGRQARPDDRAEGREAP